MTACHGVAAVEQSSIDRDLPLIHADHPEAIHPPRAASADVKPEA
jgi:hypothetical protein